MKEFCKRCGKMRFEIATAVCANGLFYHEWVSENRPEGTALRCSKCGELGLSKRECRDGGCHSFTFGGIEFMVEDGNDVNGEEIAHQLGQPEALLVTSTDSYLFLSLAFLNKFTFSDGINVDGQNLSPKWGQDNDYCFISAAPGYRAICLYRDSVSVLEQLEEAREFLKKTKVVARAV